MGSFIFIKSTYRRLSDACRYLRLAAQFCPTSGQQTRIIDMHDLLFFCRVGFEQETASFIASNMPERFCRVRSQMAGRRISRMERNRVSRGFGCQRPAHRRAAALYSVCPAATLFSVACHDRKSFVSESVPFHTKPNIVVVSNIILVWLSDIICTFASFAVHIVHNSRCYCSCSCCCHICHQQTVLGFRRSIRRPAVRWTSEPSAESHNSENTSSSHNRQSGYRTSSPYLKPIRTSTCSTPYPTHPFCLSSFCKLFRQSETLRVGTFP